MNKSNKLLAYGIDFTSFLLERIDPDEIKRIVLFGSVARGEADETSDVDIFIDVVKESNKIKKEIEECLDKFYESVRYKNYWELKGIDNPISLKIGHLNEWKELKNSLISSGFSLYDKFRDMPNNTKHKVILCWENIVPETKRVLLLKRLYGYKKIKKEYSGLIKKYNGDKLSKGSIIIPSEHGNIFVKLFKDMKIAVKIREIVEYT